MERNRRLRYTNVAGYAGAAIGPALRAGPVRLNPPYVPDTPCKAGITVTLRCPRAARASKGDRPHPSRLAALAPQDDDAARHIFIDVASLFVLPNAPNFSLNRGTSTGGGRLVERVRFLRAGFVTQPPGGPGIVPSGTTTGARGASFKRDRWYG